jgi:hypothetical protein
VQPEDGAKDMVHKVIVASAGTHILVDFEKQMRGLWEVDVFLSDHIENDSQPGIQPV